VTDGNTHAALAITRSLGKAGHWIAVGERNQKSLAGVSKYCAERFRYTSPTMSLTKAVEELASEVKRRNIDLLIPVADKTLLPVMEFQKEYFDQVKVPFPDYHTILRATEKFELFELARDCEVPIPRTVFVEEPSEEFISCCAELEFPVVIKPARSLFRENDRVVTTGVNYANSIAEVRSFIKRNVYLREHPFLIQERIIGPGMGYFVLLVAGEPIAEFSHRRIREKPPSGGVSVYSESIPVRPDMREYALRLLRALNWSGVAMVEFKLDQRTNTPTLMEINGRFWGSLQLAIDSGIDFPELLVESVNGGLVGTGKAECGEHHRWRWLLGDIDNLLLRCLKPERELSLPPGFPSRARSALNFLKSFWAPDLKYDVLKKDDLRPFMFELRSYLADLIR